MASSDARGLRDGSSHWRRSTRFGRWPDAPRQSTGGVHGGPALRLPRCKLLSDRCTGAEPPRHTGSPLGVRRQRRVQGGAGNIRLVQRSPSVAEAGGIHRSRSLLLLCRVHGVGARLVAFWLERPATHGCDLVAATGYLGESRQRSPRLMGDACRRTALFRCDRVPGDADPPASPREGGRDSDLDLGRTSR